MNLNKLYRRKTHINGVYRTDMDDAWSKIPKYFSEVIHYLEPSRWMSIKEIIMEGAKWNLSDDFLPHEMNTLRDPILFEATLEILANFDMIEVQIKESWGPKHHSERDDYQ